ncbi:R-spondin-4 isoform X1 [Phasianus colchicus]|uniref:R-spondin-2 n=1 Tax=Phasianus colchicus TaxID=9054 RepID=A0A669PFL8_PHACC|nr:R-spondin-4 isoform X1 [Phasianus colchicus]
MARLGMAWQARHGSARHGMARLGTVWLSTARHTRSSRRTPRPSPPTGTESGPSRGGATRLSPPRRAGGFVVPPPGRDGSGTDGRRRDGGTAGRSDPGQGSAARPSSLLPVSPGVIFPSPHFSGGEKRGAAVGPKGRAHWRCPALTAPCPHSAVPCPGRCCELRSDGLSSSLPSTPPAQMQWIIFMLLLFISSVEMLSQNRWKKQVSTGLLENCTGCVLCSEENGCITCHHRLFLLIWRDGIRQYGVCVHTCPPGYFGVRGLEVNRCTKCRSPSCESCFSKDFCMKCKEKFYLHKGQCFRQCPPSTAAQPGTRECQEICEPGPWSEWSACTHEGRNCGCKWGLETRVREVPGSPREEGAACPALLESRRCRLRKHCPGEKTKLRNKGKKRQKKQRTEQDAGT